MNHRALLTEILLAFGEYYDRKLTTSQIAMYVEDLMDLTPDELRSACKLYRQDAKNERFPLPAKLVALARPQMSADDVGRETAAAIIDAAFKDGHSNPDRARKRMGELAWSIISRMGGWATFCGELTNDNLPTMRAQIRDLAATMERYGKIEAQRVDNQITQSSEVSKMISQVLEKGGA